MSSSKEAGILYREFEKYFKLCTLYLGEPRQLDTALEATESGIQKAFEDRDRAYFFDIFSSIVTEEGEQIFSTEGANVSLAYSLFCEGIRTIAVTPGVGAKEIFDWVKRIYDFLKSSDTDSDLATFLWKSPTASIRVQLYSGLGLEDFGLQVLELDEKVDQVLVDARVSKSTGAVAYRAQAAGEQGWDLPIGDQFLLEGADHEVKLSSRAIEELRKELKSIGMSDRAERIVPLSKEEVESLREELSNYNLDLIEFNLLNHELPFIRKEEGKNSVSLGYFQEIFESVMNRFHPGLMLFVSKTLEAWKGEAWAQALRKAFRESVAKSLQSRERMKVMVFALGDEKREKVARYFLNQAPETMTEEALAIGAEAKDPNVRKAVLDCFVLQSGKEEAVSDLFSRLDPELVKTYLPLLISVDFEGKSAFLLRLLRSPDADVAQKAAENLVYVPVPVKAGLSLYRHLSPRVRSTWLRSLLKAGRPKDWSAFVEAAFKEQLFSDDEEDLIHIWAQLALQFRGLQALEWLRPYIEDRRLFIFPSYTKEREAFLKALIQMRSPEWKAPLRDLRQSESRWTWQSPEARKLLARL